MYSCRNIYLSTSIRRPASLCPVLPCVALRGGGGVFLPAPRGKIARLARAVGGEPDRTKDLLKNGIGVILVV